VKNGAHRDLQRVGHFRSEINWLARQHGRMFEARRNLPNMRRQLPIAARITCYCISLARKKADDGNTGNTADSFIRTRWTMRSATIALNYNYPDDDRRVALAKTNAQRVRALLGNSHPGTIRLPCRRRQAIASAAMLRLSYRSDMSSMSKNVHGAA
jgi:hypothetical protein